MMNRPRCFHALLAKNSLGKLDYCASCGVVTLHIGALSMRFDPESVETLWALLSDGLMALRTEMAKKAERSSNKLAS
jgi:hypothetical protein